MLSLRVVRGPLENHEEEQILREFNRLTRSHISLNDFRRWVRHGPEGPAYHALLTTAASRIVGHICLIALRASWRGKRLVAARTEYFFVHEGFRTEEVCGFERSFLSSAILLLDQLYRHCQEQGWGPFLVSASEEVQPYHKLVGCRPVDFHLSECLFVLAPWRAARITPNLRTAQRAGLFALSVVQSSIWTAKRAIRRRKQPIAPSSVGQTPPPAETGCISLLGDRESLVWRYPDGQYAQFVAGTGPDSYLIAKNGSRERYLRVCEWHFASTTFVADLVQSLLTKAQSERMLGVRWAVYENQQAAAELVNALRNVGFLCVPRVRRLLISSEDPEFLNSATWQISDSLFSFDL